MQKVAKNWRDMPVFVKTDNKTSIGVEYHLQLAGDSCRHTIQYNVAVFHSIGSKRSNECPPSLDGEGTPDTSQLPELVKAATDNVAHMRLHRQCTVEGNVKVTDFVKRREGLVFELQR